jgi:glyoxalase superfamily protein
VLVETHGVDALHGELRERGYPFLNPGLGPGPAVVARCSLIDPACNRLRFYKRPAST